MTDGDTDPAAASNEDLAVRVSDDGLVAWATIDRPEKRNALNEDVLRGLLDLAAAVDGGEQRVLVIRAAGDDVFSAGGDFTEMPIGGTVTEYREGFSGLARVMTALREADALTIAAVDGDCLAGGLGLAATCEFVLASESASFATPEVGVGLFPVQAMVSITRTVPEKRALKMLFTGESIDATEAHDMGLVTDVYPDGTFDDDLESFVDDLAASSPTMIAMGKEAYYHQAGLDFERALSYAREMIALVAMSEDTAEGIEAQMMDRDPEWAGR
ncbi:MAG: enoyl-CoA hydratase-related protein [Haloarculaceae archaeon]